MLRKWFGKKKKETAEASDALPAPAAKPGPASEPAVEEKRSAWSILKRGLARTRKSLSGVFSLRRQLDDAFMDELEGELIRADFGPATVVELLDGEEGVRPAWKRREIATSDDVREYLKSRLGQLMGERDNVLQRAETGPTVVLVAGVNGTGKTTSIAKIARRLKKDGNEVILAAADTFRAAAVEQLTIWSERLGVDIVTGAANADPASVAYQAAERAVESGADFLIVDTAGRLHTQKNLMRELRKIHGVLEKKIPGAPHEALLVLDATTGQNALSQARTFLEAIRVTGIVLTKLDGTAKGGIVVTIHDQLSIPVKLVGVGEGMEDLQLFDPVSFVEALFDHGG